MRSLPLRRELPRRPAKRLAAGGPEPSCHSGGQVIRHEPARGIESRVAHRRKHAGPRQNQRKREGDHQRQRDEAKSSPSRGPCQHHAAEEHQQADEPCEQFEPLAIDQREIEPRHFAETLKRGLHRTGFETIGKLRMPSRAHSDCLDSASGRRDGALINVDRACSAVCGNPGVAGAGGLGGAGGTDCAGLPLPILSLSRGISADLAAGSA